MKNIIKISFFALFTLFLSASSFAQSPSLFNYQGAARDAQDQIIKSQTISLRISILNGSSVGTNIFSEEHQVLTSDFGIFSLQIGNGANLNGSISNVNWDNGSYWLQIEMDVDGGDNYILMGASQLISVPYALHAQTVTEVDDADADPNNELQTISISGNMMSLSNNGGSISIDDGDSDASNEIQTIGFNVADNMLTLSNGGQVDLSTLDNDGGGTNSGTDDQVLSISGTNLSIEDGNSVDLSVLQDGVDDADADASNEIQTISKNGNTINLSKNGGSITDEVDDADADPTNELQTIVKNGSTVILSNNGGSFVDAVNDADADATNELQTMTKNGSTVVLSGNGGSFEDAVNDADADPANELQNLNFQNNILSLSQSNTTIDLSNIGGAPSFWKATGLDTIEYKATLPVARIESELTGEKLDIDGNQITMTNSGQEVSLYANHYLGFVNVNGNGQGGLDIDFITELSRDSLSFPSFVDGGLATGSSSFGRKQLNMNLNIGPQQNSACLSPTNLCLTNKLGPDPSIDMNLSAEAMEFLVQGIGINKYTNVGLDSIYMTSQIGLLLPVSATFKPYELTFQDLDFRSHLSRTGFDVMQSISPTDVFNRISLYPDDFTLYNSAKWKTFSVTVNDNLHGELNLYGDGNLPHTLIGSSNDGPLMQLNYMDELRVGFWGFEDFGLINTMGNNGFQNTFVGASDTDINKGAMGVMGTFGAEKAGMFVNGSNNGVMFANKMLVNGPPPGDYPFSMVQTPLFGLQVVKNDLAANWELFVGGSNRLNLFSNGFNVGGFDPVTGVYTSVSDRKLKKDIRRMSSILDKVNQLNPSRYVYRNNNPNNKESIGFVAQDVQDLFPELVHSSTDKSNEEILTLDYSGFGVLAIKAIQEQQKEIDNLKNENENLAKKMTNLEHKMSDLIKLLDR